MKQRQSGQQHQTVGAQLSEAVASNNAKEVQRLVLSMTSSYKNKGKKNKFMIWRKKKTAASPENLGPEELEELRGCNTNVTAALEVACQNGCHNVALILLEALRETTAGSVLEVNLSRALWLAAANGHSTIVECILSSIRQQDEKTTHKEQPQPSASARGLVLDVNHQSSLVVDDSADAANSSSLHQASHYGCLEVMRLLLEHDAVAAAVQVNLADTHRQATPLHYAARRGQADAVRKLLQHPGIRVNAPDCFGRTPLRYAAVLGYFDVVQAFVEHPEVDLNDTAILPAVVTAYQTIADEAARFWFGDPRHKEVARLSRVLEYLVALPQVDINIQDPETGDTVFHMACRQEWKSIRQILLQHPRMVDWSIKNHTGRLALELVRDDETRHKLWIALSLQWTQRMNSVTTCVEEVMVRREQQQKEQVASSRADDDRCGPDDNSIVALSRMVDAFGIVSLWLNDVEQKKTKPDHGLSYRPDGIASGGGHTYVTTTLDASGVL